MTDDFAAQLRKLAELRDDGLLTEDEFEAKKQQLLAKSGERDQISPDDSDTSDDSELPESPVQHSGEPPAPHGEQPHSDEYNAPSSDQPGYATPVGAPSPPVTSSTNPGLALGLSVGGLLCCGPVAIAGVIMGNKARSEIRQGRGDPSKESTATAAVGVGYVALAIWAIVLIASAVSGISNAGKKPASTTSKANTAPTATATPRMPAAPLVSLAVDPASLPATTESQQLNGTGKTDPGASITATVNGAAVPVSAQPDGAFTFPVTLKEGPNSIVVLAGLSGKSQAEFKHQVTYTKPKQWATVVEVSGRSDKRTEPFRISSSKSRIRYSLKGEMSILFVYIVDEGDSLERSGGFPEVSLSGSESGETQLAKSPGTYYLDIKAANGNWTVIIEEFK